METIKTVTSWLVLACFIIVSLLLSNKTERCAYLEKQLKQRDSINEVNIANHEKDSVVIGDLTERYNVVE